MLFAGIWNWPRKYESAVLVSAPSLLNTTLSAVLTNNNSFLMMKMLDSIRLIRNIGKFDSASGCAAFELPKLTLIYAENSRGKTTLSAIMRSLATGDPIPISERCRLQSAHPPHVVVQLATGLVTFQNNTWTQPLPNMVVFDDAFIDQNVYSGLSVEFEHRQRLHEFIIGAQGVALGKELQALVEPSARCSRCIPNIRLPLLSNSHQSISRQIRCWL